MITLPTPFKPATICWSFMVVLLLGCASSSSVKVNNYSYLYSKDLLLHPEYRVYNASEDTTFLYFKVNTANLLYTRSTKNTDFAARVKVQVQAFINYTDQFPLFKDSAEYIDTDNDQIAKDLIGRFSLPLDAGKNYLIKVTISDANRNSHDTKLVRVFKEGSLINRQGFLALDAKNGVPLISKIISSEKKLLLNYHIVQKDEVRVVFYEPSTRLARPPFDIEVPSREAFRPYMNFTIRDSAGYFPLELLDKSGIYFVKSDTVAQSGTTFFKFSESHPKITSGDQLVGPLQYIATNEEFKELMVAANKKIAAENFWIRRCGSKERAKEVIQAFYKRVEEANEYFTSYKEGWKTDRGMIYIIFGPPDGLYMRDSGENWIYGQETNVNSVNMVFVKNDNPFTDNDMLLQRSQAYRPSWYTAVDYWRTGRIFAL